MQPFEQGLLEQHSRNLELIQTTCARARDIGCGVRIRRLKDGTVRCWLDPFAPAMKILVEDED
jgi:hypothetical protein